MALSDRSSSGNCWFIEGSVPASQTMIRGTHCHKVVLLIVFRPPSPACVLQALRLLSSISVASLWLSVWNDPHIIVIWSRQSRSRREKIDKVQRGLKVADGTRQTTKERQTEGGEVFLKWWESECDAEEKLWKLRTKSVRSC